MPANNKIDFVQVVIEAIKDFYRNDASALFDESHDIDERAMVGCIYRYVWCRVTSMGLDCDVDIEYDRMRGVNGELIKKEISTCSTCGDDACRNDCLRFIAEWKGKLCDEDSVYTMRPDLIVHKRNSEAGENNFLVAEFKKVTSNEENQKYDRAKIKWGTCAKSVLKYGKGLFVLLDKNYATIEECDKRGVFRRLGSAGIQFTAEKT